MSASRDGFELMRGPPSGARTGQRAQVDPARCQKVFIRALAYMDIVRARVPLVLAIVLVLLAANMGCLSIHGIRDLFVLKKPTAPLVYHKNQAFVFFWEANGIARPDTKQDTRNVMVKPGTRSLDLIYNISIVSGMIARALNITLPISPLITLRLRTPAGDVYWEGNFTESENGDLKVLGPSAGMWVLRMEARGYGTKIEAIGLEVHDSFFVEVDLYEPK